jgi:hypothetical protein
MKLLLPILSVLFLCSCGQTPLEYNDSIIEEQNKITGFMIESGNCLDSDFSSCDALRLNTIEQCNKSIVLVESMPGYDGNTRLRDAAIALFKFYKTMNENEFKEMIDIFMKGDEITEEDIAILTILEEEISQKEVVLDEELDQAQKEFARANGFEIGENEMQEEIDNL